MSNSDSNTDNTQTEGGRSATSCSPPKLPPGVIPFAEAVAAMAESHGIERVTMEIDPDWGEDHDSRRHTRGKLQILYWKKDQRGRSSRNIRVNLTADLETIVEYTPESN